MGQLGLDLLNGFIAALQTAFGAFVPAYLSGQGWTQAQIGFVLTAETIASMLSQVPGGAYVDITRHRRLVLGLSVAGAALSALLIAALPYHLPVLLALLLHAVAGSIMSPAIAAVTVAMVGRRELGERLGRNVRYASIGSGAAAALMGLAASVLSERAVFVLAVLLAVPALWALWSLHPRRQRRRHGGAVAPTDATEPQGSVKALLADRRMQVFCACVTLFHFSSAALLAVAAAEVTRRAGLRAGLLIASFVIVPQVLVALASPLAGRMAERIGRRPILVLGFASLPLRAALFAMIDDPFLLVPVQLLEGVASAVYGVMLPLVAADLTRENGRYTLSLGVFGLAGALGAALSTAVAGVIATAWGVKAAFWTLAAAGMVAVLLVLIAMPETRVRPPPKPG
ncbi:MAG: MFS transporter [Acetobacteraceae bacterium]|nr:MFS transporter [Acetobacteraceae bacterium]